jgi:thiol-disulfide isomerase/thioredoxin
MKKLALVLIVTLGTMGLAKAEEGIHFQSLSLKEGLEKAKKENKKVFIDIYATWCGPCKMLSKTSFMDANLGEFMNDHFVSIKLDGEQDDGERLMEQFELDSYPTMLILSPDLEMLKKIVGFVDAETIETNARSIVFPESTEIYKLTKRFEAGERDKEFLQEIIHARLLEEMEVSSLVELCLELYPKLDLTDEGEFIVFGEGITDENNKYMIEFLDDAATFLELHENLAEWKMTKIILHSIDKAVEEENMEILNVTVEKIYPAFIAIYGSDSLSKEELLEGMTELYYERL